MHSNTFETAGRRRLYCKLCQIASGRAGRRSKNKVLTTQSKSGLKENSVPESDR